jgi:hypothetical protein
LTARLDRRRFDVILANLIGNALRHGGPPVTVTAHAGNHPDGGAVFTVSLPLTGQDHDDADVADAEHVTEISPR